MVCINQDITLDNWDVGHGHIINIFKQLGYRRTEMSTHSSGYEYSLFRLLNGMNIHSFVYSTV